MVSLRATRVLRVLLVVFGSMFVLSSGAAVYLYRLSASLPDLEVERASLPAARTSVVYAADGSVLAEWHGEQDRTIVGYDALPQDLRDAVVAIEDERFYQHNGVDMEAIARTFASDGRDGVAAQGGSTITQQLVKLLFTEGERTFTRRVREALLAWELENRADKAKVLETYLNVVYFGHGAYGAETAARSYFGRGASDLTLAQSATLAGLVRSPGRYSPVDRPEAALERRNTVLGAMLEQGMIGPEEERAARKEPMTVAHRAPEAVRAPYFVEHVKAELMDRLGAEVVYTGGLRVRTTLEPRLQAEAEAAARAALPAPADPEVALVSVRHESGDIVAMVGGRDFAKDKFNLAAQGRRQPGSAFKPFVLVAALESGVGPDDVFDAAPYSVPVTDGVWKVENYENQYTAGKLTLRAATNWSVNAVYARLMMRVGPDKVVEVARRMGITSPLEPNPAIALGGLKQGVSPLEMASAYGTLANGGTRVAPGGIVEVTDDTGRLVYKPSRPGASAVERKVAVQASLMLHDVVEQGTGVAAKTTVWAAGKTGTTQSYRDAWFVGYAGDLTTAVWVGHRAGQIDMLNVHGIKVTGGSFPAQVWRAYTERALAAESAAVSPPATAGPSGNGESVEAVRICTASMLLANKRCPAVVDMELPESLVPRQVCGKH